jgi:hypothetical protein
VPTPTRIRKPTTKTAGKKIAKKKKKGGRTTGPRAIDTVPFPEKPATLKLQFKPEELKRVIAEGRLTEFADVVSMQAAESIRRGIIDRVTSHAGGDDRAKGIIITEAFGGDDTVKGGIIVDSFGGDDTVKGVIIVNGYVLGRERYRLGSAEIEAVGQWVLANRDRVFPVDPEDPQLQGPPRGVAPNYGDN